MLLVSELGTRSHPCAVWEWRWRWICAELGALDDDLIGVERCCVWSFIVLYTTFNVKRGESGGWVCQHNSVIIYSHPACSWLSHTVVSLQVVVHMNGLTSCHGNNMGRKHSGADRHFRCTDSSVGAVSWGCRDNIVNSSWCVRIQHRGQSFKGFNLMEGYLKYNGR